MTLPEIFPQPISDHELKNAFLLDALTNIKYIVLFFSTEVFKYKPISFKI